MVLPSADYDVHIQPYLCRDSPALSGISQRIFLQACFFPKSDYINFQQVHGPTLLCGHT